MKKWTISVLDSEIYKDVEAETEKEAIEKILELWAKRIPEIAVEEEGKERVGTKCDSCPYYWEEADEDSPRCHYEGMIGAHPAKSMTLKKRKKKIIRN